ncbi:DNA protecting protein DprA [Chromatiales bacterium (ex Bugula neritina AB1)]|nr:DNA protecting protein DprA [Chromatiales bacterium (ex Bugula neritina AB1)]
MQTWLTLIHTRGLGPKLLHKLLDGLGSADAIVGTSDSKLISIGIPAKVVNALRNVDQERISADLQWMEGGDDRYIIPLDSVLYPGQLKEIADPPVALYVRGDPEVIQTPQLAIVGSRKPTHSAEKHAYNFAREIAGSGITITSGLAYGIDGCAHRGALKAEGFTIAVTATGLDRVYPARHQSLAQEIATEGAIISEFPIGTNPLPAYFPRRNRIITGLSYGTLVVEASLKSGTLTTAGHATEQSREVFAIPGNIDNPQARGCHALLRAGATLVETSADILTQLAPLLPGSLTLAGDTDNALASTELSQTQSGKTTSAEPSEIEISADAGTVSDPAGISQSSKKPVPAQQLLDLFEFEPQSLDDIVMRSGQDIVTVTNRTLDLELEGWILAVAGGKYIKK